MTRPTPDPVARETASTTTRLVLGHVRDLRGEAAVERVLARAAVPEDPATLLEPGQWLSYRSRIALFEAVAQEFGDDAVMFDIGASALRRSVNTSMIVLLRALGSPAAVYRSIPRAVGKFSTTSTMQVLEVGRTHATVSFALHPGYAHSSLDCLYAQGLLSVVPELFGLPSARVVHPECEQDGAPACLYSLTWSSRRRGLRGRRRADAAADRTAAHDLRRQLEALQSAAADLATSPDVPTVLRRIVELSASTVLAPRYLLAVHDPRGGEPLVADVGVRPEERAELARQLLAGEDLGPNAVVVDLASSRRTHGRLAALHAPGSQGLPEERRLLAAYAAHAAAALDLLTALEDSRRDEERARTLLGLSHELATAASTQEVCDVVPEALLRVVGCDSAGVLLWDSARGELRSVGSTGLSPQARALLLSTALRPQETPELARMLTAREPVVLRRGTAQPVLRALLDAVGVEHLYAVPLVRAGELLGVATAAWGRGPAPAEHTVDLTQRLQGVAEQAATALHNARLLDRVQHQACHDALTGLPNRRLVLERLEAHVAAGPVSVLFCDLDGFKQVNDTHGHAGGDELLRQVAARVRAVVRPVDTVGRLSGDEFAVLLPDLPQEEAEALARRVAACFDRPFRLDGLDVRVTASVGVAGGAGRSGTELLRASDSAMYAAKRQGRGQVQVDGGGTSIKAAGAGFLDELRSALREGQLRLLFQPVVAVPDGGTVAVEALVRWQHPRLGLLSPAAFLPVAEESGLVADLDLWVLEHACAALASWAGPAPERVAVNLSSAVLVDDRLLPTVRDALTRHRLEASRLDVEVVESRSLVDLPGVVERLEELHRLGIGIALDDFGTGYSTLALLQQLPATTLKIDRTFVARLDADDEGARALVRGVLALASSLGLGVVAEGVETAVQLDVLLDEGCRFVQGYLTGRPASAPDGRAAATAGR